MRALIGLEELVFAWEYVNMVDCDIKENFLTKRFRNSFIMHYADKQQLQIELLY